MAGAVPAAGVQARRQDAEAGAQAGTSCMSLPATQPGQLASGPRATRKVVTTGFLLRAIRWVGDRGICTARGKSENGSACGFGRFARAPRWLGFRHRFTRPSASGTSGRAERCMRMLLREPATAFPSRLQSPGTPTCPGDSSGSTWQDPSRCRWPTFPRKGEQPVEYSRLTPEGPFHRNSLPRGARRILHGRRRILARARCAPEPADHRGGDGRRVRPRTQDGRTRAAAQGVAASSAPRSARGDALPPGRAAVRVDPPRWQAACALSQRLAPGNRPRKAGPARAAVEDASRRARGEVPSGARKAAASGLPPRLAPVPRPGDRHRTGDDRYRQRLPPPAFREGPQSIEVRHIATRPCVPRSGGEAGRFIRRLAREGSHGVAPPPRPRC